MGRPTAWRAYVHIAEVLRRRVSDGTLSAGSLLPSEAALSTEFGVVRNTVRRALGALESEGLIETLPGRGRIVKAPGADSTPGLAYRRIAADLRGAIERGDYKSGAHLPSESSLTMTYGVSRGTARQALAELATAGLVESIQGRGWFVRAP
ncbi:GntR family transcriptional regulator [Cryptosporangium phraense]|uniref:GntR family transcriptional regulator n=1 Tax=Cryptosporangium phraense TaxID=2593070 RepID=A0A545AXX5_9ACTN|nr:GntR family transcriptional regulator [Cryptosporangium phraense]TQS46184.1 GntR family transcriptional regulator [Cryptosporangium phraense]